MAHTVSHNICPAILGLIMESSFSDIIPCPVSISSYRPQPCTIQLYLLPPVRLVSSGPANPTLSGPTHPVYFLACSSVLQGGTEYSYTVAVETKTSLFFGDEHGSLLGSGHTPKRTGNVTIKQGLGQSTQRNFRKRLSGGVKTGVLWLAWVSVNFSSSWALFRYSYGCVNSCS